ncbi:MAG: NusG domain II-containing protein [Oscillospiraceae bacterium]|nr:NusG domain II-containing protein [Oscillospiraceae bacterium]
MKTKVWIGMIAGILVVCGILSLWLLRPTQATSVEVWSEGKLIKTLSLEKNQTITVETETGRNVVTVKDGKVAVTEANCPDKVCVNRGWCSGGAQIVCLPNKLILKFVGENAIDGVAG